MPSPRPLLLCLCALAVLAAGGCGRRGALEPPPGAVEEPVQGSPAPPPAARPDRPFVLDPLIK